MEDFAHDATTGIVGRRRGRIAVQHIPQALHYYWPLAAGSINNTCGIIRKMSGAVELVNIGGTEDCLGREKCSRLYYRISMRVSLTEMT